MAIGQLKTPPPARHRRRPARDAGREARRQRLRLDVAGVAQATGARFLRIGSDGEIDGVKGIVKTNLGRFDFATKARLVGRALWRRLSG